MQPTKAEEYLGVYFAALFGFGLDLIYLNLADFAGATQYLRLRFRVLPAQLQIALAESDLCESHQMDLVFYHLFWDYR